MAFLIALVCVAMAFIVTIYLIRRPAPQWTRHSKLMEQLMDAADAAERGTGPSQQAGSNKAVRLVGTQKSAA